MIKISWRVHYKFTICFITGMNKGKKKINKTGFISSSKRRTTNSDL